MAQETHLLFMEFLDPIARKKRERQLFIGYALLTVLVLLSTYILLTAVQGYELFSHSGVVTQNGLVFMDSKPVTAEIYIDGHDQNKKTDKKLALKEGVYSLELRAAGYHTWAKRVTVAGGKVVIINYPKLYPAKLTAEPLTTYSSAVGFASMSPDQHWLVVQPSDTTPVIEVVDTTKSIYTATSFVLPVNELISKDGSYGSFKVLEWAADNRHLLLQQSLADGQTAVLLVDRTSADVTRNLATLLATTDIRSASFVDHHEDKVYLWHGDGSLQLAEIGNLSLTPLLTNVISYKTYGSDLVVYTTTLGSSNGHVTVKISSKGTSYTLGEVVYDAHNQYYLDVAHYDGSWYYAVGSGSGDRVQVYRNPLNFLTDNPAKQPVVFLTFRTITAPDALKFSPNERMLLTKSGQAISSYDLQTSEQYRYSLTQTIEPATSVNWIDDFHYWYLSAGKAYSAEFDGQNIIDLGYAALPGIFYTQDQKALISLVRTDGKSVLNTTQLIKK